MALDLSVFLKGGLHWQSGEIGIAMAATSITASICQIPAGLLVDSVRAKRLLVAISGLTVGLGCLLVACVPKLVVIVSAQAILYAASAIIPPALAALSLGIVGRKLFPRCGSDGPGSWPPEVWKIIRPTKTST